jgi:starch synthase
MKILFAASEVAPFIKTGGLADVAGSLPAALAALGHDVKVILPLYEGIGPQWREQMAFCQCYYIDLAWRRSYCGIFALRRDGVDYWFVDNEYYFKRAQIYGHYDDGERFAFFSRAVIEVTQHLDWYPDIIHCNDWQTALTPIYLLEARQRIPQLQNTKSVFTIHNIEYQGRYGDHTLEDLFGLSRVYFNDHMLEYHGDVNLMKGAIYAADYVTTVSPTYAQELQYSFYAHGLEGVIWDNRHKLRGILNGIDTALYNPAQDPGAAQPYSPGHLEGKAACKAALQQASGLKVDPQVPVIACISRLVGHKGFDLVTSSLHEIMGMDVQMVVLGTGDWNYEQAFRHAAAQYPTRFAAHIMYSAPLSSAIYSGADLFLMPSVSEPCGLSQMIAMRYGAVPIVRETGGLKDTVPPYRPDTGEGRGFTFSDINAHDMLWVIRQAVELYHNDPAQFRVLQERGMTADFTWTHSAGEYQDIYCQLTGLAAPSAQPEEPQTAPPPQEPLALKEAESRPALKGKEPVPALSPKPETPALKGREKAPALEAGRKTAQSKSKSSATAKAEPLSAPKKRATPRKKKETPSSEGK